MNLHCRIIVILIAVLVPGMISGSMQAQPNGLFFLSDCQQPRFGEKIFLKAYKNKEGRDSVFAHLERENPASLFILGDMVAKGSSKKKWKAVDKFLGKMKSEGTRIYAIPGNHEYMGKDSKGLANFRLRFPGQSIYGYRVKTDSFAVVMLNSNFRRMELKHRKQEYDWYLAVMDSLDADPAVKTILVCTHQAPFSNSKIVGSSAEVMQAFVPRFETSPKAKLFISGHSHNLEYFADNRGKHFLVCGGGGGLAQPLYTGNKAPYKDRVDRRKVPLFFYVQIIPMSSDIEIKAEGFSHDFSRQSLVLPNR